MEKRSALHHEHEALLLIQNELHENWWVFDSALQSNQCFKPLESSDFKIFFASPESLASPALAGISDFASATRHQP